PTSVRLAHLGWPQGWLLVFGELPQTELQDVGEPHLLLPRRLDQGPSWGNESRQDRGRPAARCRAGVAGKAQAEPGRGIALRHLRSLEAACTASHRLASR